MLFEKSRNFNLLILIKKITVQILNFGEIALTQSYFFKKLILP